VSIRLVPTAVLKKTGVPPGERGTLPLELRRRHRSKFPDPTGLQVLKKCRVSSQRHFCHPTSFQGRGCENGRSTEDPAIGS